MRVFAAKTKNEIGEIRQFLRKTIEEMNLFIQEIFGFGVQEEDIEDDLELVAAAKEVKPEKEKVKSSWPSNFVIKLSFFINHPLWGA